MHFHVSYDNQFPIVTVLGKISISIWRNIPLP